MTIYKMEIDPDWGSRFPRDGRFSVYIEADRKPSFKKILENLPEPTKSRIVRECSGFHTGKNGYPNSVSLCAIRTYKIKGEVK